MSIDVLTLAEVGTGGAWASAQIDPGLIPTYETLLGTSRGDVPAGVVVVWARRAFSRGRPLPPGGVLLGIDVELGDGALPLGPDGFMVQVDVRRRDRGRPVVTIRVALRTNAHEPFARVSFVLLWPDMA